MRKPVINQIKDKTSTDGQLQCVLRYIHKGWPEHLKSVALQASAYFKEHGSLSEANGLLRRGKQIVIPESMRGGVLQKINQGHKALPSAENVTEVLCGGQA